MKLWHDMKSLWEKTLVSQPRWDGNRVQFAIETEGKRIQCAISRSALLHLSGHPHLATSDMLRRFVDSRERVEEIAARIESGELERGVDNLKLLLGAVSMVTSAPTGRG